MNSSFHIIQNESHGCFPTPHLQTSCWDLLTFRPGRTVGQLCDFVFLQVSRACRLFWHERVPIHTKHLPVCDCGTLKGTAATSPCEFPSFQAHASEVLQTKPHLSATLISGHLLRPIFTLGGSWVDTRDVCSAKEARSVVSRVSSLGRLTSFLPARTTFTCC